MPNTPWQEINSRSVLFIVDAEFALEQELLLDWVKQHKPEGVEQHHVVVPIAHDPEDIPTKKLAPALELDDATTVAPIRVVWRTNLDNTTNKPRWRDLLRGNPRRPSRRRAKKIYQNDANNAICILGPPATLGELKQRYERRRENSMVDRSLAEYVAGQASLALEVAERRMRGSRYKIPRQVARQIRVSDRYKQGLQPIIEETGKTEVQLRQQALPMFKELVSIPHNFWQDVMAAFNRWVISQAYEQEMVIDQQGLKAFRQTVRDHPTAVLWTHKTHIDGIAMQSVLFENDFPTPHTVGGINMAFAGLGFLARRAGAIFIRRSFQDDSLYKLILRTYLAYLLEKRFPLTWSFEGTRSRVGKLMPPRYGILKYVMDAVADSDAQSIHIVPVAINYDMINDVKDYAAEQSGGIKRPESLSWFISYVRRLRRPLGRIYMDFGEPVVVDKDLINQDSLQLAKAALQVGVEANRVTPITLPSLMSMSLLGAAPRAQTLQELTDGMLDLRRWADHRNIRFTSDFDEVNIEHTREIVQAMVNSELITRYDEGPETIYAVGADQHVAAGYYRNTIVHHFVSKAISELALFHASTAVQGSSAVEKFWREAERLRDVFKFEFFYAPSEEFVDDIDHELAFFDKDWKTKLESDPSFAMHLLQNAQPLVAHATLRPYIEAYRIMVGVFVRLEEGKTLDEKAAVAAAFKYARQAYLQRRINSKASIGLLLFKNAYKALQAYDLVDPNASNVIKRRQVVNRRARSVAHRLENIRLMAMPPDLD